MNLNLSTAISIEDGIGELEFPQALKRDLLMSTIHCRNIYFPANPSAKNEGFFIVCDGSYHITQSGVERKNILAAFQNKRKANIISFPDQKLHIVAPKDRLRIEIVNSKGELQKVSALATFDIAGSVNNNLLVI